MQKVNVPEGYQTVMPYLIIPRAEKFLAFTKAVFGATEKMKHMREDDPSVIMHAEVVIGNSTIMFAQSNEQYPPQPAGLYVHVADADQSYQQALDAGAISVNPPADQSYGRSCGVQDMCGNTWWITSIK